MIMFLDIKQKLDFIWILKSRFYKNMFGTWLINFLKTLKQSESHFEKFMKIYEPTDQ